MHLYHELRRLIDLAQFDNGGKLTNFLENIAALLKYGKKAQEQVTTLVTQVAHSFISLYISFHSWDSVDQVATTVGWNTLTAQTGATLFNANNVDKDFTFEIVEAASRVNYAQNVDEIHALGAMVSMAATGAATVATGNYRIFEEFIAHSGAALHLNTAVSGLTKTPAGKWLVQTSSGTQEYDSVLLGAPHGTSNIAFPSSVPALPVVPYVHLHVTLFTTTSDSAKRSYFTKQANLNFVPFKIPQSVLTTAQGIRKGRKAPEFYSMNVMQQVKEGDNKWVVKIFSKDRISDSWIRAAFNGVDWIHRKEVS